MGRRMIANLGPNESVDQVFQVRTKQLRSNRAGNHYLQVELTDRSGSVSAMQWNASEADHRRFDEGDFVQVTGSTQVYQGAIQVIATHVHRVRPEEVDLGDFSTVSPAELERLAARLREQVGAIGDATLQALCQAVLDDGPLVAKFMRAPAGIKRHHAYHGGLLAHVVQLGDVARAITAQYPAVDPDLVAAGVIWHDLGKVDELAYERGFSYTDAGQLLGHIVLGLSRLDEVVRRLTASGRTLDEDRVLRLRHLIASHHGEYQFGSPKLPMTLEALVLHQIDQLDARLHQFLDQMQASVTVDDRWTAYDPGLGRKIYRGG